MTSNAASLPIRLAVRFGIAATLAVSGVIHAYLYIAGGYRHIPTVGPGSSSRPASFVRWLC
jgi:hypothetical protein